MISSAPTLTARTLPRATLTVELRAAMRALLNEHFEGVSAAQFNEDLAGKSHVILLKSSYTLLGFSTLLIYETVFAGDTFTVVYSGDTIVAPEAWNSPLLSRAWIATVNHLRRDFPRGRFYWLLLTSGFRTYRFLPVFWREFYPHCERPTPPAQRQLLDHLARERFGPDYDAGHGIVRFTRPQRLRERLATLPPGRDADPHVAFFLHRNPGHASGDELVCLTEITPANLTRAGQRMVDRPVS